MDPASTQLTYHRRRAAEERSLSERAAGLSAAQSHRELAAMHGERALALEQSAALMEERWAGPELEA